MAERVLTFDFGARHAKARRLMAKNNLDALYVSAGASMTYLNGFSPLQGGWPIWLSGLLLPLEAPAALVMTRMYHDIFVHNDSYVQDVRTYMDGEDPSPMLAALFQEKGLSHGRIGVEDWMGYGDYALLTGAVPGLQVTSGQEILDGLRMVKDAQEIEILRHVCRLMDLGYETAMQVIREGRTEAEAGMDIIRALVGAGCESLRIAGHFSTLSNRRIRRGDAVDVDLGGVRYQGYCGDSARTIFVGPPTDAERAMYDVVLEAYDQAMELVKPGVEVQAVHQAAVDVIRRAGYDQTWKIGHGIGLTCMGHEAPLLQDGVTTRLEPGMVHVIDPGVFLPDKYRDSPLHIEDVVLVTDDGYELLTQFTHELLWV